MATRRRIRAVVLPPRAHVLQLLGAEVVTLAPVVRAGARRGVDGVDEVDVTNVKNGEGAVRTKV